MLDKRIEVIQGSEALIRKNAKEAKIDDVYIDEYFTNLQKMVDLDKLAELLKQLDEFSKQSEQLDQSQDNYYEKKKKQLQDDYDKDLQLLKNQIEDDAKLQEQKKKLDKKRDKQLAEIQKEQIEKLKQQAETPISGELSGKGLGEIGQVGGALKELRKLKKEGLDVGDAITGGVANLVQGISKMLASLPDMVLETVEKVKSIGSALREGEVGKGVTEIGGLITQVGEALLSAKNKKIKLAGAIILSVGLITQAVGKIIDAVKDEGMTEEQIAKFRLSTEQAVTAEMERHIKIMEKRIELGDRELDQARERYDYWLKMRDEAIEAGNQYMGMTGTQLAEERGKQEAVLTGTGSEGAKLETLTNVWGGVDALDDMSGTALRDLCRAMGIPTTDSKGRGLTNAQLRHRIRSYADRWQEAVDIANTELEKIGQAEQVVGGIEESGAQEYEEAYGKASAALDISKGAGDIPRLQKDIGTFLDTSFALAKEKLKGVVEIPQWVRDAMAAGDTKKITEWQQSLIDNNQITEEDLEAINTLIQDTAKSQEALNEGVENARDYRLQELEYEKRILDAKKERGEITAEEHKAGMLDILEQQKALEEDQLATAEKQGATQDIILGIKTSILDTDMEIWRLQHAQNEESDKQLAKLIRQRQEQIKLARITGEYAGVYASDEGIAAYLKSQGKSEEYIKDFLEQLPKYAEGGEVAETGLAQVHKGEYILSKKMLDYLNDPSYIGAMPYNMNSPSAKKITQSALELGSQHIVNNWNLDIKVMQNLGLANGTTEQQASEIAVRTKEKIYETVNQGLYENKIKLGNARQG